MPLPPGKSHYTYADLKLTDESERIEIIYGKAYFMKSGSPAHQLTSGGLLCQFADFLDDKSFEILARPYGVRLFEKEGDTDEDIDTIVEPDLLIGAKKRFGERGYIGAPDLIVEIVEPYTYNHDRVIKLDLYMRAGVREYWLVDPVGLTVEVFLLDEEGKYKLSGVYQRTDTIEVNVLQGCTIDLDSIFRESDFLRE